MKKISLQAKVGALMFVAVILIISTGIFSSKSLSAVVSLIYSDAKPDYRLYTLKSISSDLGKAENSIRIYTITQNEAMLGPYYHIISNMDNKINRLRKESKNDSELLSQIDTISDLIENKFIVWGEILNIYNNGNIEVALKKLSDEISTKPDVDNRLLKRFFKKQHEDSLDNEKIVRKIIDIEKQHQKKELAIKGKEVQLAQTNNQITSQFYAIIEQIENFELEKAKNNTMVANRLANRTYHMLTLFSIVSTILALIVLFIIERYVRKTHAYQKALEQSKTEAENLAKAKELFMANVSHEIRTPLNALAGFLEQILFEPINSIVRKKLSIAKSSSDHLIRIVSNILDFSKLQSNQMNLEKLHFKIDTVLSEIFILFDHSVRQNNNTLRLNHPENEIPVLFGDPFRLQQILYNLLSNATKFTNNGIITFWAEILNLSDHHVRIAINVEDTGIGIPPEKMDKIFDDFTQAGPEITRKYGGTGLGLSIVKKLAQLHHGSIQVKSNVNMGSLFTCTLEYELGDPEKLEFKISQGVNVPKDLRNLKVLLVDDEDYNRMLLQSIFRKWKVTAVEAVNGLDAIELVKTNSFDLILMDARMPVLDGAKTTKFIRKNLDQTKAKIPVIMITAALNASDLEKYIVAETNAVLEKPFSEEKLLNSILSVLDLKVIEPGERQESVILEMEEKIEPNFNQLYRLIGNDQKFAREMLAKFIETTENGLQSMTSNLTNDNTLQIKELAHKLSSPCRHLNALKLLDLLKSIETESENKSSPVQLRKFIEDANFEFEIIKQRIGEHLKSMA